MIVRLSEYLAVYVRWDPECEWTWEGQAHGPLHAVTLSRKELFLKFGAEHQLYVLLWLRDLGAEKRWTRGDTSIMR